jgi:rubrerythrin
MLRPKFTDTLRYPRGYTHATNVAKTFARIRREQAEEEKAHAAVLAEQITKVRRIGGTK